MKKSITKKIVLGLAVGGVFTGSLVNATEYSLANTSRANYFLNLVEEDTLDKRLGELRQGEGQNGIWIKSFYSKGEGGTWDKGASGNLVEGFEQSVHGFQVGYDRKVSSTEKHDLYLGGFFGLIKSDLNYNFRPYGAPQGVNFSVEEDMRGYNFGIYGIYHKPKNDFYVNGTLKFGYIENDIAGTVKRYGQDDVKFEDNNRRDNWSTTVEVGKKFFLQNKKEKKGFYMAPNGQIGVGKIGGVDHELLNQSVGPVAMFKAKTDSMNYITSKLGIQVGYDLKKNENLINFYGKMAWHHEFNAKPTTMVYDSMSPFSTDAKIISSDKNWLSYGVGVSAQFKKQHNLHLEVDMTSGADVDKKFGISGGYRFTF